MSELLTREASTDPSTRMRIIGLGEVVHPGTCMVCGAANREQGYLRLGVWYDYEGEQYLCMEFCVPELIRSIGGLTPEETSQLQQIANDSLEKLQAVEQELEHANGRLRHYDSLLSGINPVTGSSNDDSYGTEQGVKPPGENSDSPGDNDAPVTLLPNDGESKSKESVKGSRPATIMGLTGGNGEPSIEL